MPPRYSTHAREQMEDRHITERDVEAVLRDGQEAFIGESVLRRFVYHRRVGRKGIYVLVEPFSDPNWVIVSVMTRKPGMMT